MSTLYEYSPDEMLHAYLDQDLTIDQEQHFYSLLAADSELSSKLRQMRTLRSESLRSGGEVAPPPAVTSALFSQLGFSRSSAAHGNRPVFQGKVAERSTPSPMRMYIPAAASLLIASLLMLLTIDSRNFLGPGDQSMTQLESTAQNENTTQTESTSFTRADTPDQLQIASKAPAPVRSVTNNRTGPANDRQEAMDNIQSVAEPQVTERQPPVTERQPPVLERTHPVSYAEEDVAAEYFAGGLMGNDVDYLALEVRGLTLKSYPNTNVPVGTETWMNNMAFALHYVTGRHAVGLEYGREPFAQNYNGEESGKAVWYEQNLATSWLVASYRYRFGTINALAGIEPYVNFGGGATTQFWPLARGTVGLMYTADHRVRFHLGLDGSVLAYPFQKRWFTSTKFGVTYGVSVVF